MIENMTADQKLDILNKWLFLKYPERKELGMTLVFKKIGPKEKHVVTIDDNSTYHLFTDKGPLSNSLFNTKDAAIDAWIREGTTYAMNIPSFEEMKMYIAIAGEEIGENDGKKIS